MTNKKKGNAFTNNPIVRAIGVQKIVVVLVLILLLVFFSVKSSSFWTYASLLSIMDYTYYLAFLGIGVTFCLITGGVDLSIGTGMFCYALAGGYLITKSWLSDPHPARYAVRRFFRLWPPLAVFVFLMVFVTGPILSSRGVWNYFHRSSVVSLPASGEAE